MKRPRPSRIDRYVSDLGVVSDAVIARKAGVCTEAVRLYRARRGILSARARRQAGVAAPPVDAIPVVRHGGHASKIDDYRHMVGQMSDRDVAKLSGASVEAVAQYRRYRKIAVFVPYVSMRGDPLTGAVAVHGHSAATDAISKPSPRYLFDVGFATSRSVTVVAHSVISALSIARHAHPAEEIVKVEKSPATAGMPVLE